MKLTQAVFALAIVAGLAAPSALLAQAVADTTGPDTVKYTPERGAVTFTHGTHAAAMECSSCHHESKPEKPMDQPRQKCSSCHLDEAVPPMKTNRKLAFHNTAEREGTCFTCHKKEAAAGKTTPAACADCHKRDE